MPLNIEPLDRSQRTAFQEREALREKVNEIIETIGPGGDIHWDAVPTAGHGEGYAVTSEGVKTAIDTEATARTNTDAMLETRITEEEHTRQTADTNIRAQIANEQTARMSEDAALGTRIDGKQDVLVSGTNIKTVGTLSLLGSGNIPVVHNFRTYSQSLSSLQGSSISLAAAQISTGWASTNRIFFSGYVKESSAASCTLVGYGTIYDGVGGNTKSVCQVTVSYTDPMISAMDIEGNTAQMIVDTTDVFLHYIEVEVSAE